MCIYENGEDKKKFEYLKKTLDRDICGEGIVWEVEGKLRVRSY